MGGRAGMARGDTYTRGGRGGGARPGKPHPRGTRRGRGGRRRLARAGPRLRAGGRVAGEAARRSGRRRSAPAAAPARSSRPAGGGRRGKRREPVSAMRSAAPQSEGPGKAAPARLPSGPSRRGRRDGALGRPARGLQPRPAGRAPYPQAPLGRDPPEEVAESFGDGVRRMTGEKGIGGSGRCLGLGTSGLQHPRETKDTSKEQEFSRTPGAPETTLLILFPGKSIKRTNSL